MRDLNELQRLAEQGHDESQFQLGYHYSKGPSKDIGKAKVWLERAAMANNPRAQYYLGELCAELGRNDPRGAYSHMAYWWNKSSNHPYWETMEGMDGRAVSKRRLVWLHMHSGYENANPDETLRLLGELSNSSPRSAIELGIVYAAGSFMPLSARLGSAPVKKDPDNGFRLIEWGLRVIESGNNDIDYALYNTIGDVYLKQDAPRTQDTLQRGIHYKRKALERASGVNESAALNIRNELAALQNGMAAPEPVAPPVAVPDPAPAAVPAAPVSAPPAPPRSPELAQRFEKFHAHFDTLTLEGKREFISNLNTKLQAKPDPDYQGLLYECVEKYRAAHNESQIQAPSRPAHTATDNNYDATRAEFLQSPGAFDQGYDEGPESTHHQPAVYNAPQGEQAPETYSPKEYDQYDQYENGNYAHPPQETEQGSNNALQPRVGSYDSAGYTDRIHRFGKSGSFMVGSVLYTLGGLIMAAILWLLTDHAGTEGASLRLLGYGVMIVLTLLPILPIASLWMIFAASKNPRPPEKSLTALSLFRFTFFFHLGVIMAGAALMALQFGADGEAFFGFSIFNNALDMVIVLVGLAIVVLYVTFFYGSLFSMAKGIRDGIYSNMFDALTGVGPFSAINYVTGIIVILVSLVVILVGVAPLENVPFDIPFYDTINIYSRRWFGDSASLAVAGMAFSLILSRAGSLLCTNVVNQFNSGLGEEE